MDGLRPSRADGFRGAFNGQLVRQQAVERLLALVPFSVVIETGTYRGTTTAFLREHTDALIGTIEVDDRYYHYSRRRLSQMRDVVVFHGDSRTVLPRLAAEPRWSRTPAFFYLDAHWQKPLPLPVELELITRGWPEVAIVIDDFEVPAFPAYRFDDYGPGARLSLPVLAPLAASDLLVSWPSVAPEDETGKRRGWVLLMSSGRIADAVASLDTVTRPAPLEECLLPTM